MTLLNQVKKNFLKNVFLLNGAMIIAILASLLAINNLERFHSYSKKLFSVSSTLLIALIIIAIFLFLIPLAKKVIQGKNSLTSFIFNFFGLTVPANFILLITTNFPNSFNQIIPIASIFHFFFFLDFLVFYHLKLNHKYSSASTQASQKFNSQKITRLVIVVLGIILVSRLFFGFFQLGQDYYSDESLWFFDRIEQYWKNIAEKDWLNTRPSDKPGITVSIISGIALLWEDPKYFDEGQKHTEELPRFFTTIRAPIVIFSTLAILIFFLFLSSLLGKPSALLATVFIGLSPVLLGISRLVNPDALLWIFLPLSFFAYLTFILNNSSQNKFLVFSGIFLGFALLTKYIANFLIVFIFLTILYQALFRSATRQTLNSFMKKSWLNYLSWIIIALSVFTLLYPGVWVKHNRLLTGTIESQAFGNFGWIFLSILALTIAETFFFKNQFSYQAFKYLKQFKKHIDAIIWLWSGFIFLILLSSIYFSFPLINFNSILIAPKSSYREFGFASMYLASFMPLIFSLGILSFLGIILSFFFNAPWQKKYSVQDKKIILLSWLFIHGYYLASINASVAPSLRYQIILIPIVLVIAALGWKPILQKLFFYTKIKQTNLNLLFVALFTFLLFTSENLLALYLQKPYYFSFNNPFLPQTMVINPKDMGEGNYEVAMWLNEQPNAKEISLWSDRSGICKFFIGHCNDTRKIEKIIPEIPRYNFYVISSSRESYFTNLINQRLKKVPTYIPRVDRLYNPDLQPIFIFSPAQRPKAQYIKIIKAQDVIIDK